VAVSINSLMSNNIIIIIIIVIIIILIIVYYYSTGNLHPASADDNKATVMIDDNLDIDTGDDDSV